MHLCERPCVCRRPPPVFARCSLAHRPHQIGGEGEAKWDHGATLAAVLPGVWHPHQRRWSGAPADPRYHRWNRSSTPGQSWTARKACETLPGKDGLRSPGNDLSVLCGLGKYCFLARFQMADDTCLHKVRDNTGRLPWIEQNSRVHKLPLYQLPFYVV